MNKQTTLKAAHSVLLVALACFSDQARADVTVWTNGLGSGGATVRLSDGSQSTTETFIGLGDGTPMNVNLGNANATIAWGPGWQIYIFAQACGPDTSYGNRSVAPHCVSTFVDLVGAFELGGTSGDAFNLTGDISFAITSPANEYEAHYSLLAMNPNVIPEGFQGTADDLVQAGIISADDVIIQSNDAFLPDTPVDLGQVLDEENLTLLVWTHGAFVVPTLSEWGMAIMALSLIAAATVILRRRCVSMV